jgi:hypothetical protein
MADLRSRMLDLEIRVADLKSRMADLKAAWRIWKVAWRVWKPHGGFGEKPQGRFVIRMGNLKQQLPQQYAIHKANDD